jgi:tetratricopeptide (TPR) repeat protein
MLGGDNPLAERWARDAIDTARLNRVDSLATRGLLSLGSALLLKSDYRGAEKYYQDGLTLATQSGSRRLAAIALLSLSGLHAQWLHIDESAEEAKQALVFFQKNNFARESIQCLVLMGRAERDRGDFASALNSFNQAAVIAEKATESFLAALAHESMGSLQSNQEHYPEALDAFEKSLSLAKDNEHIGYAAVNCANMLWRLGRYPAAQAKFERADAAAVKFEKLRVTVGISRADMALSERKSAEAALACKRLLAQVAEQNQAARADIKRILGLAQIGSGNRAQGVENCEEAYRLAGSLSDLHVRVSATLGILQGRAAGADWNGVLAMDAQSRSMLAQFPESNWKALTLAARANQALGRRSEASKCALDAERQLDELRLKWGKDFEVYLSRPDIQRVWRVLQGIPTKG